MNHFILTTSHDIARKIECFSKKRVLNEHRSFIIQSINYSEGFADVKIAAKENTIEPKDLFWLGFYSSELTIN